MGLIRSGHTTLTPADDDKLTDYLWPILREMIKTAIENQQNLVVEGGYIPFDWAKDFNEAYLEQIKYYCLIMSEDYIKNHFTSIKEHANDIECRLDDEWCTMEQVLEDNAWFLHQAKEHQAEYVLIDDAYKINLDIVERCPYCGYSLAGYRPLPEECPKCRKNLDSIFSWTGKEIVL